MSKGDMESGMAQAMDRFPERAMSIRARFRADQRFREMCGDYAEALQALQRWRASSGPHRAARVEEYRELAEGLELEIVTALRSPAPKPEV
jgi:hypothetical protein